MATEYWEKAAEDYSKGVISEELTLKPIILELIGNVNNKQVLDLGCGDGRYSIVMAKMGATVTGIDASKHQIEIAEKKHPHNNIEYAIGDASDIEQIKAQTIDLVLMNLVVPDMKNNNILERTFLQIKRVLKQNGRFIFSTLHPLYLSPDQDQYDRATGFKKENYYKEGHSYKAESKISGGSDFTFNETHFSLTFLSKVLEKNGFLIKRIIESKSVPEKGMYLPKYIIFDLKMA
jgi:2-polyprenyl-3-methyl-5-hydroxy-6-metoxy-1,4-benzoquinol methylase